MGNDDQIRYVYAIDKAHAEAIRGCWCYSPEGAYEDLVSYGKQTTNRLKLFRIRIVAEEVINDKAG